MRSCQIAFVVLSAGVVVSPAWAAGSVSPVVYGLAAMVGLTLVVVAAILVWRMVELSRMREESAMEVLPEAQGSLVASEPGGLVDIALMDTLQLADGVLIYVLRLNDRVLLVGKYGKGITSLGDFPLSWLRGETRQSTYRPAAMAARPVRVGRGSSARLVRDEREWERRREELIRMLQERGE